MAPRIVLVQTNPTNVLMVEVTLADLDQPVTRVNWRQMLPTPIVDFGDFAPPPPGKIITFEGEPSDTFRLAAVLYDDDGGGLWAVPTLNYNPTGRARLSAAGLSLTSGRARMHIPQALAITASGLSVSSGRAALRHSALIAASGLSVSSGRATFDHRGAVPVSAAGARRRVAQLVCCTASPTTSAPVGRAHQAVVQQRSPVRLRRSEGAGRVPLVVELLALCERGSWASWC